jgi:hypothetical protein
MVAADKVAALDVIARFVQDWHAVLFRLREDSRKVGDLDESEVNSYMPKAIVELFYADPVTEAPLTSHRPDDANSGRLPP